MKLLNLALCTTLFSSLVYANEPRSAGVIYTKKCAMCHTVGWPQTKEGKRVMAGPPIDTAMFSVVVTIDAVDGPMDDKELKKETVSFLKDYLFEPTKDKANCEDRMIKRFGLMPSLKGFISKEELDVVVPWVYDNYKPKKIDGKFYNIR